MSSNSKSQKKTFNPSRNLAIIVGVVILLFLLGLWGLHRIANGSTPKDILYPIDRGFEQIRRAVTFSPVSRANLALDSFNERQHEAQSLVLNSDYNVCDLRSTVSVSGNDEAILTALNTSQEDLAQAEAEILQIKDGTAKEELNARLVQVVGHHLQIWESISKFVPTQTTSALKQTVDVMAKSLDRAFTALPEGRRNDLTTQLRFNLPAVVASINGKLGICEENKNAAENADGTGNGNGNGSSAGTNTSNTNSRINTGNTGSTGAAGRPGTSGSTGTGGNTGGTTGSGTNVNVNSDAGINIDAGINDKGQLYLEPTIAPSSNNGTDSEASINDSDVVNTNACPGPQVLGVCL
jgi:hypothetical protein